MWNRRRICLLLAALMGIALAVYFEPSHCVRGWLWGEAFFDGRPTSYWRARCDEWLERFDDEESLKAETWLLPFEVPQAPGMRRFGVEEEYNFPSTVSLPMETFWKRCRDFLRTKEELDRERSYMFAPQILWATSDTVPVLEELVREEKYRLLATIALRRVLHYQKHEAIVAKEMGGGLP
jgi:hypothetical protein